MATAESEVITAPDEDSEGLALFKKAMRMLAEGRQKIADATEMLEAMNDKAKRVKSVDANGEPTWTYLLKQPIPKDFRLTKKFVEYAAEFGFTEESAKILMHGKGTYEGFIAYYVRVGTKWQCWSLVFKKWVRSERDRKDKAQSGQRPAATRFDKQRTRV